MPKFADKFVDPEADPRTDPPSQTDELATIVGFLRWQRATLELKCAGLDAVDLAATSVESSTLSPLGRVRHMADVERRWFRRIMAGQDATPLFKTDADPDAAFNGSKPDPQLVAEAWQAWQAEVAFSDDFIASAPGLELPSEVPDTTRGPMSLRWVIVHMVEEYARHNGHADLLRQRIDCAVGQ